MTENHSERAACLELSIGRLKQAIPEAMNSFSAIAAATAKAKGSLVSKTKELIATAIAVVVRCDGYIISHTTAAETYGASRTKILETLSMAIYMGGGPSVAYAAQALDAFDQFSTENN